MFAGEGTGSRGGLGRTRCPDRIGQGTTGADTHEVADGARLALRGFRGPNGLRDAASLKHLQNDNSKKH